MRKDRQLKLRHGPSFPDGAAPRNRPDWRRSGSGHFPRWPKNHGARSGVRSLNSSVRVDGRDIIAAFKAQRYQVVRTATELKGLDRSAGKVLGIFKEVAATAHSSRVRPSSASVMNVAYDKLKLTRPGSE
ncbi:MAG: hypothetical protein EHM79_00460, partial [Geobacter sp.]